MNWSTPRAVEQRSIWLGNSAKVGQHPSRRVARFWNHGHTPGPMHVRREGRNPDYPLTLDLRRAPEAWLEGAPSIATEQGQAQQ
jgi:hypothetical protein